ncbi:MAG: diguanylate cyclase [Oscillospiraceae bacterium]|nr:diguanylate cyclase [Oscillospiraceae bacterium]
MKQFQFAYSNLNNLRRELTKIDLWRKSTITSRMVFQIFSEILDKPLLQQISDAIRSAFPDALYMGCTTNGSICAGELAKSDVVVVCNIFEFPTTQIDMMQYHLTDDTARDVVQDFLAELEKRPWVKAVEMFVTIRGMSMTVFCDELQKARQDIRMYGGGAFLSDINDNNANVFSCKGDFTDTGVVFLLLGGEDLHVRTTHIAGWKPLGKTFCVTRAENNLLYELDNAPAYQVYYNYLNIRNDENFFTNSLEFPFFYEHNGIKILRAPIASNPDGSLTMTADLEENVAANLAYGDPWTILEEIRHDGETLRDFCPEAIHIYSCAARRTFWGDAEISKESMPFQSIAPTTGFYTSGEFLRTDGKMNQHNVTLVVAAMREGDPPEEEMRQFRMEERDVSGKVSMISRLARFIEAATRDLEQANNQLSEMAVTDGLTRIYNRAEIQRRIKERLKSGETLSLIMLDIDNFKHVNDAFGHKEGDAVIIGLADLLRRATACDNSSAAGRWGGEEFMVLVPESLELATKCAADCVKYFAEISFPAAGHQTVSVGVTQAKPDDTLDTLLVRVDKALYQSKTGGKNRYTVL